MLKPGKLKKKAEKDEVKHAMPLSTPFLLKAANLLPLLSRTCGKTRGSLITPLLYLIVLQ